MKHNHFVTSLLSGVFCLGLIQSAMATDTIYDNSANDLLKRFDPGTLEVGDEINLAGTSRYLTQFDFEYWGTSGGSSTTPFTGSVQAEVKFYLNDGPLFNGYATPGTVIFDSGLFGGFNTTDRSTLVFSTAFGDFAPTGLYLPANSLTWSVQFSGMAVGDAVGVDLYSPPVVGSSQPDYWQNSGTSWSLLTNNTAIPMNFAARMFASAEPVPEPSTEAFAIVSAVLSLGVARWKIRSVK